MVLQEMMGHHPVMSLRQKVQRLQEKSLLPKLLMRANLLQRLPQMGLLPEMDLLLATLLLQEMRLLPQMFLHLPVLLPLMHQRLQHPHQRQLLSQQMQLHLHHHR